MVMNTIKSTARIAGLLYLLQIPLGVFGILYLPVQIVDRGSWGNTVSNLLAHETTVRLSIVSAVLCALVTVATAHYIAKVLSPVDRRYARLIRLCTLVAAPLTLANELNHVAVLLLLDQPLMLENFSEAQLQAGVSFFLQLHAAGMQLIGIFFGLWLLPMGYLVIRSGYIPKVIGYFLLLTCAGYLADFFIFFLFPSGHLVISEYTWAGEVMMVGWLLVRGINEKAYHSFLEEKARVSAQNAFADPA